VVEPLLERFALRPGVLGRLAGRLEHLARGRVDVAAEYAWARRARRSPTGSAPGRGGARRFAQRAGHLLEREDVVHVVGAAQACGQARKSALAARAAEVELSVGARETRVPGHSSETTQGSSRTERRRVLRFAAASAAHTVTPARTLRPALRARRVSRGTATDRTV